jgi:hypothetical protein
MAVIDIMLTFTPTHLGCSMHFVRRKSMHGVSWLRVRVLRDFRCLGDGFETAKSQRHVTASTKLPPSWHIVVLLHHRARVLRDSEMLAARHRLLVTELTSSHILVSEPHEDQ